MSDNNDKSERSLSEVLSEVLKRNEFEKTKEIILHIEKNGEITPKEAEKVTNKSSATVRRYLKFLVESGYIEVQGNTNNTIYKRKDEI